jgi:hypothetical protein
MKQKILPVIIFTLLLCVECSNDRDWQEFKSYEGGFSVETPGVLRMQAVTMETLMGPIDHTVYTCEEDRVVYMVQYAEYPDSILGGKEPHELLNTALEGAKETVEGEIMKEKAVALGRYRGVEVVIRQTDKGIEHHMRVYVVGNRLYQLAVRIPLRREFEPLPERFFNSFHLLT